MKKIILLLLAIPILLFYGSGISEADYMWPHDGYNTSTGSCNNCHLSASPGSSDLKNTNITQICYTCHNGTGSKYNEESGLINGTFPTMAGGFQINNSNKTVTSIHKVDQTFWKVPGSSLLVNYNLTCDSCHNPHGSPNYRSLRTSINNFSINVSAYIPPSANGSENVYYLNGMDSFCSACHENFNNETSNLQYKNAYRHKVGFDPTKSPAEYGYKPGNGLPLESNETTYTGNSTNQTVSCVTCHYAHSTKVAAVSNPYSPYRYQSELLRVDSYGVCVKCHALQP